jgi:hypothetical protein
MTPRQVDEMTDAEFQAFERLQKRELRDAERANRSAQRGR